MIFIKSCPSGFVMHFTNFSSFLHVRDRHVLHHLSEVGELVVHSMSPYRRREEAAKKAECTGAKTARPKFRSELGHLEKWTHNMVSIKFASSACTIQRNPFSYFVSFPHKEKNIELSNSTAEAMVGNNKRPLVHKPVIASIKCNQVLNN